MVWTVGSGTEVPSLAEVVGVSDQEAIVHYPKRVSRIKRKRSIGFRARMRTSNGRKLMNRKRRVGRTLNVADN